MATAKKTPAKKTGRAAPKAKTTPLGNTRAIDDNYVAPKRKPKPVEEVVTFQQALEEAGQTVEDLTPTPEESPLKSARAPGTSNLATTIKNHRKGYHVALAPNGKKTQNCGDFVAAALLHATLADMKAFVQSRMPGVEYDRLNPGHQRMCYGNRIRAWAKANEEGTMMWLASLGGTPVEGDEDVAQDE